ASAREPDDRAAVRVEAPPTDPASPNADPFDRWVFGTKSPQDIQQGLKSSLDKKVKESIQICGLTEPQSRKLQLAGRGDISHYFHRVEEGRAVFLRSAEDPDRLGEIHQLAARLRVARSESELFGPGSLFAKTHRNAMEPAQLERYEAAMLQGWRTRYAAQLDSLVTTATRDLKLNNSQRERFRALLGECPPPRQGSSALNSTVLLLRLAEMPEARLKAILTEDQSILLGRQIDRARKLRAESSDD
ncbi:hypothetical protein ACYOEI_28420, partial [Singulisphaera rosea]